MNNQYAESVVRRIKKCIMDTREIIPDIRIGDWHLQMLLNNLMHDKMEGQEATAHQSIYMTYGQDEHIKQNYRTDWPDVRNGLLQQFLDKDTQGPTDGPETDSPSRRKSMLKEKK